MLKRKLEESKSKEFPLEVFERFMKNHNDFLEFLADKKH